MSTRRTVPAVLASAFALLFFGLGNYLGARQNADSDVRLAALRAEVELLRKQQPEATGTAGRASRSAPVAMSMMDDASRSALIADVKRQLQDEMGLLPLTLLRERRNSFVEVNAYVDQLITIKENEPGDDLLSRAMAEYAASGEEYTRRDLFNMIRLLMNGGHETTASMLSLGTAGVVSSVAVVNDEATCTFMGELHEELLRGGTVGEAVLAARQAAARDPVSVATAAAFVAFGT